MVGPADAPCLRLEVAVGAASLLRRSIQAKGWPDFSSRLHAPNPCIQGSFPFLFGTFLGQGSLGQGA